MADRNFHNESTYAAPGADILNQGLQNAVHSISGLFHSISQARKERMERADAIKETVNKGKRPGDVKLIEEGVKNVVDMTRNDIKTTGTTSERTQKAQKELNDLNYEALRIANIWSVNKEHIDQLKKDNFLDTESMYRDNDNTFFGIDHEKNITHGSKDLEELSQRIGTDIKYFKRPEYTHSFVENYGIKKNAESGKTVNHDYSSPFIDPKTGKPGVTDEHALTYLNSRPEVLIGAQKIVDQKLLATNAKYLRDSGKVDKNATDQDILVRLKDPQDPLAVRDAKGNVIPYNSMVMQQAKDELMAAANVTSDLNVNYKNSKAGTGDGSEPTSKHHAAEPAFFVEPVGVSGVDVGKSTAELSGPGQQLFQKGTSTNAGKPITIEASSNNVFDIGSGKTEKRKTGSSKFNVTGYQLQAYENNGKPFYFQAKNNDDLIRQIKEAPDTWFKNLEPKMAVALRGYSLSEGKFLGDITTMRRTLADQLSDAKQAKDSTEISRVESAISELENLKNSSSNNDYLEEDLANLAAENGIKSVRKNQLLKADNADLKLLKGITGMAIGSEKAMSEDEKAVATAYEEKYKQAAANNFGAMQVHKLTYPDKPKTATKKPKTVVQNGFTYTLNEATGEYE